jgi:hypothetical protein
MRRPSNRFALGKSRNARDVEKLYDALRAANVPDEKARAAAVAANFESRLNKLDADMTLIKWMLGFNLAFTIAILWKVFV